MDISYKKILKKKIILLFLLSYFIFALMLFLPVGSFMYMQGWFFLAVILIPQSSVPILRAITSNGVILASYFLIFIALKENNFASRIVAVF
jgi:hypothetical protein